MILNVNVHYMVVLLSSTLCCCQNIMISIILNDTANANGTAVNAYFISELAVTAIDLHCGRLYTL